MIKRYIFLAILALPFFVVLDESSVWDANEAFYVQTPREMLERGDWLIPYFNGEPRLNKPPLSYWVVGLFYKFFGVSLFWERFVLAALGFGCVLLTYRAGILFFNSQAALLAAGMVATTFRLLMVSRRLLIDVLLLFCLLAVLVFFLEWLQRDRRGSLVLAGVFLGLAFLAKGPVALLAPAFLGLFVILQRKQVKLDPRRLVLPSLLFLIIASSWFLLLILNRGWAPVFSFFFTENLGRFSHVDYGPTRGLFYYAGVFLGDFFPWSLFFVAALVSSGVGFLRSRKHGVFGEAPGQEPSSLKREQCGVATVWARAFRKKRCACGSVRPALLLLLWVFGFLIVFSLSHNKQEYYILPAYPAASLWLADRLVRQAPPRWLSCTLAMLMPATMVAVYVLASHALISGLLWLPLLAAPLVALSLMVRRLEQSAAALAVFYALAFISYLPPFEIYKPIPAFAQKIREESRLQEKPIEAGYFNLAAPSLVFYLGRPVFEAYSLEDATAQLRSGKIIFMIVRAEDYDALCAAAGLAPQIVDSRPKLYTTARFLLEGLKRDGYQIDRRTPAVYLVTNKSADHPSAIDRHPGI